VQGSLIHDQLRERTPKLHSPVEFAQRSSEVAL
jgi:hypothetical protein